MQAASKQASGKQEPEIVNVPEAAKFFSLAATTRATILVNLNLNSLIEYIDHLEGYRKANMEKVATLQKQCQGLLTGAKILANNPDQEKHHLLLLQQNGHRVAELLEGVEEKLEAFQLKRMLAKGIDGVHLSVAEQQQVNPITTGSQISQKVNQLKDKKKSDLPKLPPIFEEIKVEDFSGNSSFEEFSMLPSGNQGLSNDGEDDDHEEDEMQIKLDNSLVVVASAEEQSASDDSATLKQLEETVEKVSQSLANEAAASLQASSEVTDSPQSLKATLSINGHQLPVPGDFNRLSPVEQNLLLAELPEAVRASYLNLSWTDRFYEHLASMPIAVKQQLLRSLKK